MMRYFPEILAATLLVIIVSMLCARDPSPAQGDSYYWGYLYKVRSGDRTYYTNKLHMQMGFLYFNDQYGQFQMPKDPEASGNPGWKRRTH